MICWRDMLMLCFKFHKHKRNYKNQQNILCCDPRFVKEVLICQILKRYFMLQFKFSKEK
jgi:hypothetical protein